MFSMSSPENLGELNEDPTQQNSTVAELLSKTH